MKRLISILFIMIIILMFSLSGCSSKDVDNNATVTISNYYNVNDSDVINIGALLPLSGENKLVGEKLKEGLSFACDTASNIYIDKQYKINLIIKDIADNLDSVYKDFVSNKVAAVVCCGTDSVNTDAIVKKFSTVNTPLIFTDNYSKSISDSHNGFSVSVAPKFQISVISGYVRDRGCNKGALIASDCNAQNSETAELFKTTLSQNSIATDSYFLDATENKYSTSSIIEGSYDFVFIYAPTEQSKTIIDDLRSSGYTGGYIVSEVIDNTSLCNEKYEDVVFVNKFEYDDDNYIGSDFINVYSENKALNVSDVNSSIAYGYDSYMLIYEVLHSYSSEDDLLSSVDNNLESGENDNTVIKIEDILSSMKTTTYLGVTDKITFDETGIINTEFLYLNKISAENSTMINKYNFR